MVESTRRLGVAAVAVVTCGCSDGRLSAMETLGGEAAAEECPNGTCNWQDVEFYDGSNPYFSRAFVDRYQGAAAKTCSGTMISRDLYLTIHHCGIPTSVSFNCQLDGTQSYPPMNTQDEVDAANALAWARCETYQVSDIPYEDWEPDIIVARLSGHPGDKYGWVLPSVRLPPVGEEIALIQHPQQRASANKRKVVSFGPVSGSTNVDLQYDAVDMYGGSSGAGVLDQFGRLVGVLRGGGSASAHGPKMAYVLDVAQPARQAAAVVWAVAAVLD